MKIRLTKRGGGSITSTRSNSEAGIIYTFPEVGSSLFVRQGSRGFTLSVTQEVNKLEDDKYVITPLNSVYDMTILEKGETYEV